MAAVNEQRVKRGQDSDSHVAKRNVADEVAVDKKEKRDELLKWWYTDRENDDVVDGEA